MLSLIGEILWPCSSEPRLFCYDILELRHFLIFPGEGEVEQQYASTAERKEVEALQWLLNMCIQPTKASIAPSRWSQVRKR
jgi:hypothetical protein